MALRLARRELRGGVKGLWTFLGCLAVGVAAMAAVGTLSQAFKTAVESEAAALMGGDLEISLSHKPLAPDRVARLDAWGRVSHVVEMRAMAARGEAAGARRALVSLKAVDGAYPLMGTLALSPPIPLAEALAGPGYPDSPAEAAHAARRADGRGQGGPLDKQNGLHGAVVHPDLLTRIGAKVGDVIAVGDADFQVRAAIALEPDRSFRLLAFGPRVIVSLEGLHASGLDQPGSMVRHEYRVALKPGLSAQGAGEAMARELDDPAVRVRTAREASPTLRDGFMRLGGLMALVGLSALLLGGLGVSEAVAAYLEGRTRSIAVYKAVGASNALVFWAFFAQIAALSLAGVALGAAAGALAGWLAAPALAGVLPVAPKAGVYPEALGLAALFGLITAMAFAVPPLSSRTRVSPLTLFRGYAAPMRARPGRAAAAVSVLLALALAALVLKSSPDQRLGLGFVGSATACAAAFWLLTRLFKRLARALPEPSEPRAAHALRGLYRPGSPTGPVMACLGLGLTVLAAVTLSDANFQNAMRRELPAQAPSFFFLDVQPHQVDGFRKALGTVEGVTRVETSPSLRGRIVKVKGVPSERLAVPENVAWAIRGDRSLSYARAMPGGAQVTAGRWWPPDYSGPPLVSLDAEVAKGLGLTVGDTLSVSVLGREVELTVSSLRRINWLSLELNYALILSPGVIDDAPMTYLATAYVDPAHPGAAEEVYARVGAAFGNVSIQRVDEALEDVGRLARQIALAVRASAVVTLLAGLLVLAQSIRAAMARRVYETVICKVCGATRRDLMIMLLIEHGLAGLAAGLAALVLGAGLSWFFVTRYMSVSWSFFAGPVLTVLGLAIALTLCLSLRGIWRMLSGKAWPYLRNE
jgi:putative ABC transport system permease protein